MPREFARVARAEARPGFCVRCQNKNDLLDLGADQIPGFGVIYFCTRCMGELAAALQLVPAADAAAERDALTAELTAVRADLADARLRANRPILAVNDLLEGFTDAVARAHDDLVRGLRDLPAGDGVVGAALERGVDDEPAAVPAGAGEPAGSPLAGSADDAGDDLEGDDGAAGEDAGRDGFDDAQQRDVGDFLDDLFGGQAR